MSINSIGQGYPAYTAATAKPQAPVTKAPTPTGSAEAAPAVDRYVPSTDSPEEVGYIPPQKSASGMSQTKIGNAYTHYADGEKIDLTKKSQPPERRSGESQEKYSERCRDHMVRYAVLYIEKLKTGTLTAEEAKSFSGTKHITQSPLPKQMEGESDEDFKRHYIDVETRNSWKSNLKQWLDHIEGWRMGESARYLDEQGTAWATDLMENHPAMFRQWLEGEKWNVDAGRIDVCVLPRGFTEADFYKWMEKDVLDYL